MKIVSPNPYPCLSVVVPCYNEEQTIKDRLGGVLESPRVAEVVVVDDGATDATPVWAKLARSE